MRVYGVLYHSSVVCHLLAACGSIFLVAIDASKGRLASADKNSLLKVLI
jgi:hypothetical protein